MFRRFLFIAFLCVSSLSCANLFSELSEKDSDKAKLYDAKRFLDQSKWTEAITKIQSLSATYAARRDVKALLASAYAGRCGIDMLNLINAISSAQPSEKLFTTLFNAMASATAAEIDDCAEAEEALNSIGVVADRTVDENLLMTFVEFGKIGAILNVVADTNDDNTLDPAFDACNDTLLKIDDAAAGNKANANQLVAALATAITSLQQTGSTIAQTDLSDLQGVCNPGAAQYNICTATDAASVTTDQRKAIRAITNANEVGLVIINADTPTVLAGCTGT